MKVVLVSLAFFAITSVAASAQEDQTVAVQTSASKTDPSTVRMDDTLTFDLSDDAAGSAPLPAGTRDYEDATPVDVEQLQGLSFSLE